MQASQFFVSVIIPVHNGERFLAEVIRNVLEQQYQPLEIIVIDDGSTDNTRSIANHYKGTIRYIYQSNQGPSAARNLGIKVSQGNIIAFLDVDDLWTPNKLSSQIHVLTQEPSFDIVQGLIKEMKLDESISGSGLAFEESSEPYHFLNLGSAIYRKSVFDRVGLFDETLRDNEDTDWFLRAWKANISKKVINEVTLYYRKHEHNVTHKQKHLVYFGLPKIFKKHRDIARFQSKGQLLDKSSLPNFAEYMGKPPERIPEDLFGQRNFTIVSNDCWGSGPYQHVGKIFHSPFIGTRVFAPCFLTLLKNFNIHIHSQLRFISTSKYAFMNERRRQQFYPIGQLNDAIEIHFLHESDEETARRKWERRVARIQWKNLFVKFSEDPGICTEGMLRQFEKLHFPNKVCFTRKEYPQFPSTISIPEYFVEGAPMYWLTLRYVDAIGWLSQKKGAGIHNYKIQRIPKAI